MLCFQILSIFILWFDYYAKATKNKNTKQKCLGPICDVKYLYFQNVYDHDDDTHHFLVSTQNTSQAPLLALLAAAIWAYSLLIVLYLVLCVLYVHLINNNYTKKGGRSARCRDQLTIYFIGQVLYENEGEPEKNIIANDHNCNNNRVMTAHWNRT